MRAFKLAVVLSSAVLLASGLAQAESKFDKSTHQNQFISKRAYQQPLPDSAYQKDVQWEGATLVNEIDGEEQNRLNQQKTLRVNMLSKRPF